MTNCKDCPDTKIIFGKDRTGESIHPLFRVFCVDEKGCPSFGELRLSIPLGYDRVEIDSEGMVIYKKDLDDWESPRSIDGYERDPENPSVFRPLWVPCKSRVYSIIVRDNCQCIDVIAECLHNPSEDGTSRCVQYEHCEKCTYHRPYRRPAPQKKTINNLRVPNLRHNST